MPLLDAFVGTGSNDLHEAIFGVDTIPEEELFENLEEDERPALRSIASSTRVRGSRSRGRTPGTTDVQSPPTSPTSPTRTRVTSNVSPMRPPITISTGNLLEPGQSGEAPSLGMMSPLARLFGGDSPIRRRTTSVSAGASLKKVETLLGDIKNLPVNKLTEEMRELQVRFIFCLSLLHVPRLSAVRFAFSYYPLTMHPLGFCTRIPLPRASFPSFF